SNYDTDLFAPLIAYVANMAGKKYGENEDADVSVRVVADHARASAFLVGDGVLPSNEGRGYVLRRIIRRAARHGKLLGLGKPFLHEVAMQVASGMGDVYPELLARKDFIDKVITGEEERFLRTLDRGLALLDEVMAELRGKKETVIPGDAVFMLYDTFGFPVDLTQDIAGKEGFAIDGAGFEAQMELQREKARTSSSFGSPTGEGAGLESQVKSDMARFVGYDVFEIEGTVLELKVRTEEGYAPADGLVSGQMGLLVADETPFYGESGGQVGDTGTLRADGLVADVQDASKSEAGIIIHHVAVRAGEIRKGQKVTLAVDHNRRKSIMRHHSATHLLQKALREVLGEHVHQSGSLVNESRLRFDFTHFAPMKPEEIARAEAIV
ncbi:MAG TPA: alanine--tRNA ligase-related protein, partial [Deltaproteobacteria bacterium]|nr:alanine--tRNA ligase-related protein [Deltaproteobacteria bacterium]